MHRTGLTSPQHHTPLRTCVGCRRIDAQDRLLRAVADTAGRLRFDTGRWRSPGRGCYVHQAASCVQAAARGGFQRSLRRSLRLNENEMQAMMAKPPAQLEIRGHSNRDNS